VNRHNIDDLENIAALLLDEIGLPAFSTNEAQEMGTARCHGQDVVLTWAERHRAGTVLLALKQRYGNRIEASAGPLAVAEQLDDLEKRITLGEKAMIGRGNLGSCGGVFTKMAVLHDGTMVPCNLLPAMSMGIVGKTSLQEAWLHHPSINAMRQRQKILLHSLASCKDCRFVGFCSGGCPAGPMAKYNQLNMIDPTTCYRLYKRQGEAV
jgi:SynChlorMet cassette radical SAM/SPASM protein ScmE